MDDNETNRQKYHADATRGESARGAIQGRNPHRVMEDVIVTRPSHITNTKHGKIGTPIRLESNYFPLVTSVSSLLIYQYHVEFRPEIENKRFRLRLIHDHRSYFGGYIFDGMHIFSTSRLPNEETEFQTRNTEGEEILIIVKFVRLLSNNEATSIQVHNLLLRRLMQGLNLNLVGRNYFDAQASVSFFRKNFSAFWFSFSDFFFFQLFYRLIFQIST